MRTPSAAQLAAAIDDYNTSRDPIKVVSQRNRIGRDRLARAVKEAGVSRPRGPSFPAEVQAAALADWRKGMTMKAVAEKHGVGRHNVRAWAMNNAEDKTELTGGRWVRYGLVSRWVPNEIAA